MEGVGLLCQHRGVVDEAGLHAMEASNKSRTGGIIIMPTTVMDPPRAGEVKPATETGKERSCGTAGIVIGRATRRVSARRRRAIRIDPDWVEPNKEIGNDCITPRAPKESETERA